MDEQWWVIWKITLSHWARASKLDPQICSRLSRTFTVAGRVQTADSSPEDQEQWLLLDASQAVLGGLVRGLKALFVVSQGNTGSGSVANKHKSIWPLKQEKKYYSCNNNLFYIAYKLVLFSHSFFFQNYNCCALTSSNMKITILNHRCCYWLCWVMYKMEIC